MNISATKQSGCAKQLRSSAQLCPVPLVAHKSIRGNGTLLSSQHSRVSPSKLLVQAFATEQLERPVVASPRITLSNTPLPHLAYEIIQGNTARFTNHNSRSPPTAVLIHGILGSRRNMQSFARRLVEGFPTWQIILVDLRCHGESAPLSPWLSGQHGVDTAANDVLRLLSSLKLFPEVLIGHSFGGKVAMSMAHQFGIGVKTLPRPVKVWALDSLPGEVRSGEMGGTDRPVDLITALQRIPLPQASRSDVITFLERSGFSKQVSAWVASNLRPLSDTDKRLTWTFDLDGIASMYRSYEETNLWPFLSKPAEGIQVSFVRAEHSSFRWGGGCADRIAALGHDVHLLKDSGHWVHTDNPDGLFQILAPTFGQVSLHMQRHY